MRSGTAFAVHALVLILVGNLGAQVPRPEDPARNLPVTPDPDRKGKPISISEGRIPIQDFLKFLSDYTGLPVLHNSSDPALEIREIHLSGDIKNASADVVKQILEINGVRVYVEALADGGEVMKVEAIQSIGPVIEDPRPTALIKVGPDGAVELVGGRTRRAPPPAQGAGIEERLSALEGKVQRILDALHLDPPEESRKAAVSGKPDRRQAERIEVLNRRFEARLAALQKEHQEALRKLTEEFSEEEDAESNEPPPGRVPKAVSPPKPR